MPSQNRDGEERPSTSTAKSTETPSTSTNHSNLSSSIMKGAVGGASFIALACGLRSAWKYSRFEEAKALKHAEVLGGVGFATRALAVATCITVSGFTLAVVTVSWMLNVNTPRQFGTTVRNFFGDSLRLESSKKTVSSEDLEKLLSGYMTKKEKQESETSTEIKDR